MNFQQQQFYQVMTKVRANSKTASSGIEKEDVMVTEVMNGLIVSRPAKRIEHISELAAKTNEPQATIWNLTKDAPVLESKTGSVPGINKLKVI